MKKNKIVRCEKCHHIAVIQENEMAPACCGTEMTVLEVHTEGALEDTHLPVIARKDGKLYAYAGAYEHPMEPDHYIEAMILESEVKDWIVYFHPGEEPKVALQAGEGIMAVDIYCSRHGLWKTEI